MNCQGNTSACNGQDLMPVRLGLSREVRLFCAPCRETSAGMGVQVIERRTVNLPVAVERRHPKPRWLSRLVAREDASWRAA